MSQSKDEQADTVRIHIESASPVARSAMLQLITKLLATKNINAECIMFENNKQSDVTDMSIDDASSLIHNSYICVKVIEAAVHPNSGTLGGSGERYDIADGSQGQDTDSRDQQAISADNDEFLPVTINTGTSLLRSLGVDVLSEIPIAVSKAEQRLTEADGGKFEQTLPNAVRLANETINTLIAEKTAPIAPFIKATVTLVDQAGDDIALSCTYSVNGRLLNDYCKK